MKIASKTMMSVLVFALLLVSSHATSQSILTLKPHPTTPLAEINITQVQVETGIQNQFCRLRNPNFAYFCSPSPFIEITASCSYRVTITTSCSSPTYTRDQVSLAFADAYGNQVYAPMIEDPSTGTFERCSVDTYDVSGTCLHSVCILYLYRSGYDGWKPQSVQVYGGYNAQPATFYYKTLIPNNIWFGLNCCSNASTSAPKAKWFGLLFQVLLCILCCKSIFDSLL